MKQLTSGDSSASAPRWSPDGKKIAYVTGGQIWVMDDDGDDKEQVTKISTGAAGPVWSPDGKWIAFTSDVYPECTNDDCNRQKEEQAEKSKVKAHILPIAFCSATGTNGATSSARTFSLSAAKAAPRAI